MSFSLEVKVLPLNYIFGVKIKEGSPCFCAFALLGLIYCKIQQVKGNQPDLCLFLPRMGIINRYIFKKVVRCYISVLLCKN